MTVARFAACGHREDTRYIEDGECRNCRGVERLTRVGGYVAPDDVERDGEALDHAEKRSRYTVVSGQ